MKITTNSYLALLALLAFSACSSSKSADQLPPPPSSIQTSERSTEGALAGRDSEIIEATVRITAIDRDTRVIIVRDSKGELSEIKVPAEVRRFNDLKVGDSVVVRFARAVAFEVRQPTAAELSVGPEGAVVAMKNAAELPPGMELGAVVRSIVTIQGINLIDNTVTVKGDEGAPITIKARYPENLKRVKVGDKVVVFYGEAIAVEIVPAS